MYKSQGLRLGTWAKRTTILLCGLGAGLALPMLNPARSADDEAGLAEAMADVLVAAHATRAGLEERDRILEEFAEVEFDLAENVVHRDRTLRTVREELGDREYALALAPLYADAFSLSEAQKLESLFSNPLMQRFIQTRWDQREATSAVLDQWSERVSGTMYAHFIKR